MAGTENTASGAASSAHAVFNEHEDPNSKIIAPGDMLIFINGVAPSCDEISYASSLDR